MASSNSLSQRFDRLLKEKVGDPLMFAPSICLSVIKDGKVAFQWQAGEQHTYYDLASLTKILFSVPVWMRLLQDSTLKLEDHANTYLPWWTSGKEVSVQGLLTHTAGLDWWKPYYSMIGPDQTHLKAWEKLKLFLSKESPGSSDKKAIYSDLDLFYLGFIAQELFQKNLPQIWEDVLERMNYKDLHFQDHERSKHKSSLYAPTGYSQWRSKDIVAEVHDDNAAALGGVAPHAGLFGTIKDMESYLLNLRSILKEENQTSFRAEVLKRFITRQTSPSVGDFGLIFMKPTKGASSGGRFFDDSSFGHTGFTGTSIWYSPKKDFGVILLSNRTYYGSEVELFRHFRPLVHDLAVKVVYG